MKNKFSIIALLYILIPLMIIICVITSFVSGTSIDVQDNEIVFHTPQCSYVTIDFKDVKTVELTDKWDVGEKKKGKDDGQIISGYYIDQQGNEYFAFIHHHVSCYIVLSTQTGDYVFNLETQDETIKLEKQIKTKLTGGSNEALFLFKIFI